MASTRWRWRPCVRLWIVRGCGSSSPLCLRPGLGAAALHDPTEGGLATGLHELARASGVRIRIDQEAVLWFEPGLAVCRALGADPWCTLASGTLLAAFPAETADAAVAAFAEHGHPAAAIGAAEVGSGVYAGDRHSLPWPERDEVARLLSNSRSGTVAAEALSAQERETA